MGAYAGESVAKKCVRAEAYNRIAWIARHWGRLGSCRVLALAGPEAADLGCIRGFGITHDPGSVLVVDTEGSNLEVARSRWPGVRTFRGWLHDVPCVPWPIDVAVLDFCSTLESSNTRRGIARLRGVIRDGTALAITFLQGREPPSARVNLFIGEIAKSVGRREAGKPGRIARLWDVLCDELGTGLRLHGARPVPARRSPLAFHPMAAIGYRGHKSSMVVAIGVFADEGRSLAFEFEPTTLPYGRERAAAVEFAEILRRGGWDPCAILNANAGTLAAWKAHVSRGTYGDTG